MEKQHIHKLEPGDIIIHALFGELTILERDEERENYLVAVEECMQPARFSFKEVEEVCEIKR